MAAETFFALTVLAFTAAFTPGPNNALVAASGANFGLRRSLPHVAGIAIGFPVMVFIVGLFLGELFQRSEFLRELLRWGGAGLLLYIAWKIATSGGLGSNSANLRPFTFFEAAAFQWINPKGWAMAIGLTSQFMTGDTPVKSALVIAGVFLLAGSTSASTWAVAGKALTRWINTEFRQKIFNRIMAGTIAAFVVMLLIG